jgi:SWI/SNF-related matrix-associated actin-dependent regulator of chromatin subfamily A member 5
MEHREDESEKENENNEIGELENISLSGEDEEDEDESEIEKEKEKDQYLDGEGEQNGREVQKTRRQQLQHLKSKSTSAESQQQQSKLDELMAQSEIFSHFLREGDEFLPLDQQNGNGIGRNRKDSQKAAGRASRMRLSEEVEDKQLMKIAQTKSQVTRLMSQPSTIVSGTMRSYQVEGLNWLLRLHQNGINGILADEMGLGTLSSLPFTSPLSSLPS